MNDPIAITGCGVISAAGATPEAVFASVLNPPPTPASELYTAAPFELAPADRRVAAKLDRTCELGLFAAREASREARLDSLDHSRVGVAVGTSRGPVGSWTDAFERLADKRRMRPTLAAAGSVASPSGAIVAAQHLGGPSLTASATCASAAHAIVTAALWLNADMADTVIAGGTEAPLNDFLLSQMRAAGLIAPLGIGIRPFDENRAGFLPGEGAAFIVMEKRSHAETRSIPLLGTLNGWSLNSAPSGKTGVEADGATLIRTLRDALTHAGLTPGDIGYINAHGTGTRANDGVEARALASVLPGVPLSSTKPVTGHCLGATPAIEASIALSAMKAGQLPPNANCDSPIDSGSSLNVLKTPESATVRHCLSLSSGFWGNHAALVFSGIN